MTVAVVIGTEREAPAALLPAAAPLDRGFAPHAVQATPRQHLLPSESPSRFMVARALDEDEFQKGEESFCRTACEDARIDITTLQRGSADLFAGLGTVHGDI